MTRDELAQGFDFSGLRNDVSALNNNLTNGIYNLNTNLLNGFAGTNAAINSGVQSLANDLCAMNSNNLQNTNQIIQAVNADTVANMQNTYGITAQMAVNAANQAEAECQTKQLIQQSFSDLNYNLATLAC